MNKKIVVIIALVMFSFLAFLIFLLVQNKKSTESNTNSYSISITTKDKNIISAMLIKNNKTTEIDPATIKQYAHVSFNSTYEILWAFCPEGYKTTKAQSNTNNKVNLDPVIGASTDIVNGKNNNIIISCEK